MGIEGLGGSDDDVGLAVKNAQCHGRPDSQVAFRSPVRRCRCWSGGQGSMGRLVGVPLLQPHYPANNVQDMY